MTAERITIQIESNIGADGPMSVSDVLHQFLDAFELAMAAVAAEPGGEAIKWQMVAMSKNSPAMATAEAYSIDPAVAVRPIVFSGKRRLAAGLDRLATGTVEPWLAERLPLAKALLKRNLNGVGKTTFDLEDELPQAIIVERIARAGLQAIGRFETDKEAEAPDLSRTEWGSIEANVAEAKTYHSQPALYVKERLSSEIIPCVLSKEAAQEAGETHNWDEVWSGKRVRIEGQIFYDRAGKIARVRASRVIDIAPKPVDLDALRKINILDGMDPPTFLDRNWEGDLG